MWGFVMMALVLMITVSGIVDNVVNSYLTGVW